MEAASKVGINLSKGYNGDITARQAGSVGGGMVCTVRLLKNVRFMKENRVLSERKKVIKYIVGAAV